MSRTVQMGIIGLGYCGRQHLKAAAAVPGLKIVALADQTPPRELEVPKGATVHDDWRCLLQDPRVEAVSICLPHFLHAEITLQALELGKHVLLEKPLAHTLEDARRIEQAARRASSVLMVEMTHRFFPAVREGRERVQAGRLGTLFAVEDRAIERVMPERAPAWMFDKKLAGGGVAMTDGIHLLDRVAWVSGQTLRYHHGSAGFTQKLGDVEDTAMLALALADGTPVSILTSFQRAGGNWLDDELTLYGTAGTLRIWAWRGWRFEGKDGSAEEHESFPYGMDLYERIRIGMAGALCEFVGAIAENRPPRPGAKELLAAQEIVAQFYAQTAGEKTP